MSLIDLLPLWWCHSLQHRWQHIPVRGSEQSFHKSNNRNLVASPLKANARMRMMTASVSDLLYTWKNEHVPKVYSSIAFYFYKPIERILYSHNKQCNRMEQLQTNYLWMGKTCFIDAIGFSTCGWSRMRNCKWLVHFLWLELGVCHWLRIAKEVWPVVGYRLLTNLISYLHFSLYLDTQNMFIDENYNACPEDFVEKSWI